MEPLDWALHYAAMGYRVLPVVPGAKVPLTDPALGLRRGKDDATSDPVRIRSWWGSHPDAGVAILPPEGVLVLDLDSHLALSSLMLLAVEFHEAPKARSGGGGAHVWLRLPEDAPPLSARTRLLPPLKVDLRGMGKAYLVVPPSLHPSGRPYEWILPLRPPHELPLFPKTLLPLLLNRSKGKVSEGVARFPRGEGEQDLKSRERAYALAELRGRAQQMASTPEGQRHNELVRHAVALWGWVRRGVLHRSEVFQALTQAALSAGLEESEIWGVLRWVETTTPVRELPS